MKVSLIDYQKNADRLLVFTKGVRFGATAGRWAEVNMISEEEIRKELAYMAETIPSSWEFAGYTFCIEGVSRAFTHQFVRNRHGSYAQESLRVVEKANIVDQFVWPERLAAKEEDACRLFAIGLLKNITSDIATMKGAGVATEDLRAFLPTNISTNIVAKFNLRTLSELAKSRTGGRTQGEYVGVMNAMIDEVLAVHPWADVFLAPKGRDYFAEIEAFAEREYGGDLLKKGELLKIVDKMRKESK